MSREPYPFHHAEKPLTMTTPPIAVMRAARAAVSRKRSIFARIAALFN